MFTKWLELQKGCVIMNIKNIYLDGFKNLDSTNIELSKISALLSTNNYGKSNFLDGIDFALRFIQAGIKGKYQLMNLTNLMPILNINTGKNFKFEIEFLLSENELYDCIYGYEFQWGLSDEHSAKIINEYLKIKQQDSQKYSLFIDRNYDKAFYKTSTSGRCDKSILIKDSELLVNKLQAYDNLSYIKVLEALNDFEIYIDRHFDSKYLYNFYPLVTKDNDFLSPAFDNEIAQILNSLKTKNKNKYNLIINTIKDLFPDIVDIDIWKVDFDNQKLKSNYTNNPVYELSDVEYVLYMQTKQISKQIKFKNMSDGVKRILSILTYVSLADYKNIPLIAIEEPENSIHPGLLKKFLIALSNFTNNSKIIITSHSPYLINYMDLSSTYIGIPNNDEIAHFRKIKKSAISKINNNADNMDMMAGEYLFDLMSGYSKSDIENLKKYLEND